MTKALTTSIVLAALAFAIAPASAAKLGCSGTNMGKTEDAVTAMPDGDGKDLGNRELALAQEAMLKGKMGECAVHVTKAMNITTAK
jgi:hypothetical protein